MNNGEKTLALLPTIRRIARRYAHEYPGVDADDIQQTLCVHVMETGERLALAGDGGRPATVLSRVADSYCGRQFSHNNYVNDQYNYRPKDIRAALDAGVLVGAIDGVPVPDDPAVLRPPRHRRADDNPMIGWDRTAYVMDIREAFRSLPDRHQRVLVDRYIRCTPESRTAAGHKRVSIAIGALTKHANGQRQSKHYKVRSNDDRFDRTLGKARHTAE
ncbi:sigma-70 family RNA polymerase sigma factor [Haloglycomyces albus]|uniref:sigma-70 family RNA polymerase sigma factor n=1 Tax=Haloglycomyces albus TaxID=526067 RepID=UPI00046CFDD5|nr:sigma-70 family RNA polymerase sigma factor [Haloglycomyces albus]